MQLGRKQCARYSASWPLTSCTSSGVNAETQQLGDPPARMPSFYAGASSANVAGAKSRSTWCFRQHTACLFPTTSVRAQRSTRGGIRCTAWRWRWRSFAYTVQLWHYSQQRRRVPIQSHTNSGDPIHGKLRPDRAPPLASGTTKTLL
jgi:hypothetical protein